MFLSLLPRFERFGWFGGASSAFGLQCTNWEPPLNRGLSGVEPSRAPSRTSLLVSASHPSCRSFKMLDRIDSGVHGNSKSCPAHTQQLAAFHSIAAVTSSETPLPQAAERPSTPPPPGRYSHDERDVEAQRKRYFDQGKPRKSSRFVITPDLNGLETCESDPILSIIP